MTTIDILFASLLVPVLLLCLARLFYGPDDGDISEFRLVVGGVCFVAAVGLCFFGFCMALYLLGAES